MSIKNPRRPLVTIGALAAVLTVACATEVYSQARDAEHSVGVDVESVTSIPRELRERLAIDDFYQQYTDASGLPIIGSSRVRPEALQECAWLVKHMLLNRPDILRTLAQEKVRFVVMAHNEYTTDLPEYRDMTPKDYWDKRARGLGATPEIPVVSGGEENLLAFPGDPYPNEIIALHEFAHAIHLVALQKLQPDFQAKLDSAYQAAMEQGLWKDSYAATNAEEYWAEAVQCWFDNNDRDNEMHTSIDTRAKLKDYDPRVATLCLDVFGETQWRYTRPAERTGPDRRHLESLEGWEKPRFHWRRDQ